MTGSDNVFRLLKEWEALSGSEKQAFIERLKNRQDVAPEDRALFIRMANLRPQERHGVLGFKPDDRVAGSEEFKLIRHIATGGMGEVWLAEKLAGNPSLIGGKFAIKFARSASESLQIAILEEAKLLKQLSPHPNIVRVHQVFPNETPVFFCMDYIPDGKSVRDYLTHTWPVFDFEQRLSFALKTILGVASAIEFLHSQPTPVFHRDLKPENILLDEDNVPRITDLGLSVSQAAQHWVSTQGTELYMSPAQHDGSPDIHHNADIWAIGVIFYELLASKRPYMEVAQITKQDFKHPDLHGLVHGGRLPREVVELCDRCLVKNCRNTEREALLSASELRRQVNSLVERYGVNDPQPAAGKRRRNLGSAVVDTAQPDHQVMSRRRYVLLPAVGAVLAIIGLTFFSFQGIGAKTWVQLEQLRLYIVRDSPSPDRLDAGDDDSRWLVKDSTTQLIPYSSNFFSRLAGDDHFLVVGKFSEKTYWHFVVIDAVGDVFVTAASDGEKSCWNRESAALWNL
ncbi:MAG: serine/threonine-protein kinase [Planctomycetota bacterium]